MTEYNVGDIAMFHSVWFQLLPQSPREVLICAYDGGTYYGYDVEWDVVFYCVPEELKPFQP